MVMKISKDSIDNKFKIVHTYYSPLKYRTQYTAIEIGENEILILINIY